jgi:hypothetical protein
MRWQKDIYHSDYPLGQDSWDGIYKEVSSSVVTLGKWRDVSMKTKKVLKVLDAGRGVFRSL